MNRQLHQHLVHLATQGLQDSVHTLSNKPSFAPLKVSSERGAAQPVNLHPQRHPSAQLFVMMKGKIIVSFISTN